MFKKSKPSQTRIRGVSPQKNRLHPYAMELWKLLKLFLHEEKTSPVPARLRRAGILLIPLTRDDNANRSSEKLFPVQLFTITHQAR
jgi:hypothetical protein